MICTVRGQLWELLNLNSPSFIIAKVEMKYIHFIVCKKIDELKDIILRGKVSRYIKHETTVSQIWPVFDYHIRDLTATGISLEVVQCHLCIHCTVLIRYHNLTTSIKDNLIPSGFISLNILNLRHVSHYSNTIRRYYTLERWNHIPHFYLYVIVWKIGNWLGRQELVFYVKFLNLTIIFQSEALRSPTLALQWAICIFYY